MLPDAFESIDGIKALLTEHPFSAVQAQSLIRNQALAAQFLRTLAHGYVLQEEVLRWEEDALQEASDRPPITFYRVHLRACVALPVGSRDAYFVLTGELNKPSFVAGEEARLTMRCGRECYVTIFNLAANDRFSILFPNSYESVVALRSREVSATRRKGALN